MGLTQALSLTDTNGSDHMNLYFRLFIGLIFAAFRRSISVADSAQNTFRVLPTDIDLFGHMNNGRYLQIMDVARSCWMLRSGVIGVMAKNRWSAVLGGGTIRFRRALKPLESYRVTTRLICWDRRWFYLEHGFIDQRGNCIAVGMSRAALRHKGKWVPAQRMMDLVAPGLTSEPMPAYLRDLNDNEEKMNQAFVNAHLSATQSASTSPSERSPENLLQAR